MARRDPLRDLAETNWPRAVRAVGATHKRLERHDPWTGTKTPVESRPKIDRLRQLPNGVIVGRVHAAEGTQIGDLIPHTARLAASLPGVATVHIEPRDLANGTIYFVPPDVWPNVRPWRPTPPSQPRIEFATDAIGRRISAPLMDLSFLIAASRGGGKSSLEMALACGAAARQNVILVGIDPKVVELSALEDRMSFIACDPSDLMPLLGVVVAEVERRYNTLRARGLRKITEPSDEFPALITIADELRVIVDRTSPSRWKTHADAAKSALTHIAALGRACATPLVAATQHPHSSIIDSTFRSQLTWRWCGRTEGPSHAEVIIGKEAANQYDTKALRAGTGYFQCEDRAGETQLILVDWVSDDTVRLVNKHTAPLRPAHDALDKLRQAGTYNPVITPQPAPQPDPEPAADSDVSDDVSVFDAVCLVAELAGRNPAEIYDLSTVITAVGVAAEAVEYDPERRSQLEAAVDLLSAHFSRP